MCFSKKQKKIIGRWFEGLGIGIIAGSIVTFSIGEYRYWYFLIVGAVIIVLGTNIHEK